MPIFRKLEYILPCSVSLKTPIGVRDVGWNPTRYVRSLLALHPVSLLQAPGPGTRVSAIFDLDEVRKPRGLLLECERIVPERCARPHTRMTAKALFDASTYILRMQFL